jgi:hypothetical protein
MALFFNQATRGFYDTDHNKEIPEGSVRITKEQRIEITEAFAEGKNVDVSEAGGIVFSAPKPSQEEIVADYEAALDDHLDGVARRYRYADRTRLALRAGYPNQHQILATAFGTWMDTCNDQAKQLYLDVSAGLVPMPSIDGFIGGLPEFIEP